MTTKPAAKLNGSAVQPSRTRVLLVDDDSQEFALLDGLLSVNAPGAFGLEWVATYEQGLNKVMGGEYDVCLIDYRLSGAKTGLDLLRELKRRGARTPLILLTGLWDTAIDLEAMRAGAADYLVKGQFGPELLERSLRYSVAQAKALEALKASEERYRTIVEGTRAILFQIDAGGRIVYVNEAAARVLGLSPSDLLGRHCLRFVHAADRREALRAAADGRACELRYRGAAGKQGYFSVTVSTATRGGYWGLAQDITEKKRLEDMFVQSEKMSAMGFLAAGIAHELATPLSIIGGSAERLADKKVKGARVAEAIKAIGKAAQRCSRLVAQMLEFGHKEEGPAQPFDLRDAVSEAAALVEPRARMARLELVVRLDNTPVVIKGWRTHVEQVAINLVNNSIDATPKGGRIELCVDRVRKDGRAWARLQVVDDGSGMPPEVIGKVTEPFFTTKASGRGTGLGLALASETAVKHGGALDIQSAVGRGTTVTAFFPLS